MSAETLLAADAVTVVLGGRTVVDRASLRLGRGEVVALVGPNGAGKTTLLRALAGIEAARGDIRVGGIPLAQLPPRQRAKAIAYLPQGHTFHWPMRVDAIVALGRLPHADAFMTPTPADRDAVAAAISATGLDDLVARPITALSGGERARVAIARALATQARVLLADEPTISLDPRHQLTVMEVLRRAAASTGGAVLLVVHDLALAARYSDRVVVLDAGRIACDAAPPEALTPARIAAVFGVDAVMVDTGEGHVPVARRPL
jgi:iron complex transport system ATP-binding protein